jgi:hypothetical protein
MGCGHSLPAVARTPRTPDIVASRTLSRLVRDSASSLRRGQLSDPATEARNIVKAASRAHFSTIVPLDESDDLVRVFYPSPDATPRALPARAPARADRDAPESTSTTTLDAGFGPARPDPSVSKEDRAEAYLASLRTTLDSTLEETPMPVVEGFSAFSIDHFDRVDRRRDRSTANQSGWGPPGGWSEHARRVVDAEASKSRDERAPFQRVRQRAFDRATARLHAAIELDPRSIEERRSRSVPTEPAPANSGIRTGDPRKSRPPPRRERAEAGYYPASYRVALPSGGRDTTASCALRAASRRAEASPTVRAVPLRAGRPPTVVAPMSAKMRVARAKLAELELPGEARRARRRDDVERRVLVPKCANERNANGTSRPTSHLPERFGAGFGGAARRWAR